MKVETYRNDYWQFGIELQNPYEYYDDMDYCYLIIRLFNWSWWITIPEIFKPKREWREFTGGEDLRGRTGYWNYIRREYGFLAYKEGLHIYYGIQPGSWLRKDPKNSDHTWVYFWPWQHSMVRWDLLYPNGDVYYRNTYPLKSGQQQLGWYDVFNAKTNENSVKVAEYVELRHITKDGTEQIATIRLTGEEHEWRPRWTQWLPFFNIIKRTVDCYSNIELGEKAGSWKGGLMGWSCEWKHGETMEQAFWRWYEQWDGR